MDERDCGMEGSKKEWKPVCDNKAAKGEGGLGLGNPKTA